MRLVFGSEPKASGKVAGFLCLGRESARDPMENY